MSKRLRNTRHERFAREVAALTPLAVAYREAGFGGDARWHAYNASKLAHKPRVRERIEELRAEFETMSAIHADYIRHQLLWTVDADPRELYEKDPDDPTGRRHRLRAISELPRHLATAISRVKIDPESGQPVEVILGSKTEAAGLLLRSLGGLVDRREVSGPNGGPVEIAGPAQLELLDDEELQMLEHISAKIEHAPADADAS
jgi:Terminase small subunit